jgi:hypothetical protein
MNFKHSALKVSFDITFINRDRHSNSRVIARKLTMAMFESEILEGYLLACLSVYLHDIICRTAQPDLLLIHVWKIDSEHNLCGRDHHVVQGLNAGACNIPARAMDDRYSRRCRRLIEATLS